MLRIIDTIRERQDKELLLVKQSWQVRGCKLIRNDTEFGTRTDTGFKPVNPGWSYSLILWVLAHRHLEDTAYTKCNKWHYSQTVGKASILLPRCTRTSSYWPGGTDWAILVAELCPLWRGQKSHTTPYQSHTNGKVKRVNRHLGDMLHLMLLGWDEKNWDFLLT